MILTHWIVGISKRSSARPPSEEHISRGKPKAELQAYAS